MISTPFKATQGWRKLVEFETLHLFKKELECHPYSKNRQSMEQHTGDYQIRRNSHTFLNKTTAMDIKIMLNN